jgi:hypothetical protein
VRLSPDYSEARFFLVLLSTALNFAALMFGKITGGEWTTLQGTIVTLYAVHSALDDKLPDRKGEGNGNA